MDDRTRLDLSRIGGQFIAEPLLTELAQPEPSDGSERRFNVILDLDARSGVPRRTSRANVFRTLEDLRKSVDPVLSFDEYPDDTLDYVFANLSAKAIRAISAVVGTSPPGSDARAIHRIWEDHEIKALLTRSVATVKADAAHISFAALGADIVWAVLDTGVDGTHEHFKLHDNLALPKPLMHRDFTKPGSAVLVPEDPSGHGTHVAGIIAGAQESNIRVAARSLDANNNERYRLDLSVKRITGVAPQTRIMSLRVLDERGIGRVSFAIAALSYIQQLNDFGRNIVIHGVNLSLGYNFNPNWFACGQSPLCVEVNRLVKSGVNVVVAAGNAGYGVVQTQSQGAWAQGNVMSINDPGNAELAVTVGSTHRERPHTYGVSFFSSKGPTGDGRRKPDILAPGERIISCAAGNEKNTASLGVGTGDFQYLELSGTSAAAPHVSGTLAAILSIRREYIERPTELKSIVMKSATDLARDPNHQGAGLVDLMRAIQSI